MFQECSKFLGEAVSVNASNADDFIKQNRDFLYGIDQCKTFVDKYEAGSLGAYSVLCIVRPVVFNIYQKLKKENNVHSPAKSRAVSAPSRIKAKIVDENGNVVCDDSKELMAGFDLEQRAVGWAERKLLASAPGSIAVIDTPTGCFELYRDAADDGSRVGVHHKIFRRKREAWHKITSRKSAPLTSYAKAKQDHCHFSKG